MVSLPSGTVTFLFTDIEASTRLLAYLGNDYVAVIADHHRLLRAAFLRAGGTEVRTQGDAFFVVFPRARDAVSAAVAAQRALAAHAWPPGVSVRVRMGLHTGEPTITETGYEGMDVHRAARICEAGHGGQILLSETTAALLQDDLPGGVGLRDIGVHRLKDLARAQRLFQITCAGLPADFPPIRSLNTSPNNLPRQLTSFVGREREMAEVKALLQTTSLLTLSGSGGAGKTRLALQVSADVSDRYADGVWLIELAALSDAALVPSAAAFALGAQEQPGRALTDVVVDVLRRKSTLLILDNCEHLLHACAELVHAVLRVCPGVRVLATSREPLRVPGEVVWRVPSLSLPDPADASAPEDLTRYEAVRLFVERASLGKPGVGLTPGTARAVVELCRRLDGIPLALELAAARAKGVPVVELAARLHDRFRLLTDGSRTALPRQQTLRAAIDWSYDLLSDQERVVFRRLAVFAGGFDLDAAERVCAAASVDTPNVLGLLASLVSKSLVIADLEEARYRLLETVREYARERLEEADELGGARDRHRLHYVGLAESLENDLRGPDQFASQRRLEVEQDNLRAALLYGMEDGQPEIVLRLAAALWRFWYIRGYHREGRTWLERALAADAAADPAGRRAQALDGAGYLATDQGDFEAARAYFEASLTLHRARGHTAGVAESLHGQGRVAWRQGQYDCAERLYNEALEYQAELGASPMVAVLLNSTATLALAQGDLPRAVRLLERGMAMSRSIGYRRGAAVATGNLGTVALRQGRLGEASLLFKEDLTQRQLLGDKRGIISILVELGLLNGAEGQSTRAANLLGAAEALGEVIGAPLSASERAVVDYETRVAAVRADLGDARFSAAWAAGRAMTLDDAIAYATAGTA